jgi:hypothetical protein
MALTPYSHLVFISISGAKLSDLSFSADTGMGECLIIGQKTSKEEKRATFVVLKQRPASNIIGSSIANQVLDALGENIRKLEDGPVGGTVIRFGNDVMGFA